MKYLIAAAAILVVLALPDGARASGVFQAVCGFSHRASDDPIVFPGQPGKSHSHDFLGNRSTSAFSSPSSLFAANTNCFRYGSRNDPKADHSAYWVPTLYVKGAPITAPAGAASAYYSSGVRNLASIKPYPAGLRVIAGDAKGITPLEVNGQRVVGWFCPGGTVKRGSATVAPTCATSRLDLAIRFPDCWDGVNVDSPNHKSHMAYSKQGASGKSFRVCPSSHPVLVPMLELTIRYPTKGGPGVSLASGSVKTAHADFMNGWESDKLLALCRICLKTDKYCGGGDVALH